MPLEEKYGVCGRGESSPLGDHERQQVLGTQYPPSRLRPSDLLFHKVSPLKDSTASWELLPLPSELRLESRPASLGLLGLIFDSLGRTASLARIFKKPPSREVRACFIQGNWQFQCVKGGPSSG